MFDTRAVRNRRVSAPHRAYRSVTEIQPGFGRAILVAMTQPGYDALADLYAETFPNPYEFPIERHACAAFAEAAAGRAGRTLDVGCGLGHVAADLTARGLDVLGIDPSPGMLAHARRLHPHLPFVDGDASLAALPTDAPIAAILARFSLIHVAPAQVRATLRGWAGRVGAGTPLLVAFQAVDEPGSRSPSTTPWRPPGAGIPTPSRRRWPTRASPSRGGSSTATRTTASRWRSSSPTAADGRERIPRAPRPRAASAEGGRHRRIRAPETLPPDS